MKRFLIPAFAAIALLAAATSMLRSHASPTDLAADSASVMPIQALHSTAGAKKLPIEDFEDQSLVFSTKR
jgi:hypothetical protein